MITAPLIRPIIAEHAQLVDEALAALFSDPDEPINLDGLVSAASLGEDAADILVGTLYEAGKMAHFLNYLRARDIDPAPLGDRKIFMQTVARFAGNDAIGEPPAGGWDFPGLGRFAPKATAFRCRILVGGAVCGSGALVAPNLVLTAMHVVEDALKEVDAPAISVGAADGSTYRARCIWHLRYHEDERQGGLPPLADQGTHFDVALLHILAPLGQLYGHITLPTAPPGWTGPSLFTLVHYPEGRETGFCSGRVRRDGNADIRFPHDIDTAGGSSGAAGFDGNFQFLGIHQGRWKTVRRLVPFERFSADARFRDLIAKANGARLLWSLDAGLDGRIIIGRRQFATGLAAMLDKPETLLRGLWIRRTDTGSDAGLGFSFEMLRAYLLREKPSEAGPAHRCFRIATGLETRDLVADLAGQALGDGEADAAHPGTQRGETTSVAEEDERARRLVDALEARAAAAGQTFWFFFDNPPNGLERQVQFQFEHLARRLPASPRLRLVLAGFETYRLAVQRFERPEDAVTARSVGLLVEELGPFTRLDVLVTLREMLASLAPEEDVAPVLIETMVDRATRGFVAGPTGEFRGADLDAVIGRVRGEIRHHLGLVP